MVPLPYRWIELIPGGLHVTNTPTKAFRVRAVNVHEAVAVGPAGYAVYTFQGETTHHLIWKKTSNKNTNGHRR